MRENILLVEYNYSVTKNGVEKVLHENTIRCIELQNYSPDLNPIENLYGSKKQNDKK